MKEAGRKEREGLSEALHVLNSSDEEALLAHILDAEHASSAEAMVLFALRKGSFNCLLAPPVDPFANRRPGEECDIIQSILPNMPRHHPSCRFAAEALLRIGLFSCLQIGVWVQFGVQFVPKRSEIPKMYPVK